MKPSLPFGFLLALACLVGVTAEAQDAPPAAVPTFTTQVEEVLVDVVVADKKGGPIANLEASDFLISEDGVAHTVTNFERVDVSEAPQLSREAPLMRPVSSNQDRSERMGRTFALIFDDINLAPHMAVRAKAAVTEFLTTGVRDGDRVLLVATSGAAWWTARMPWGRDEMIEILKRLDGRYISDTSPDRMSEHEALRVHVYRDLTVAERVRRRFEQFGASLRSGQSRSETQYSTFEDPLVASRAQEVYFQAQSRIRLALDAIRRVSEGLAGARGRKSVVLISQGFVHDPSMVEFKDVMESLRRANAAIYFLDTRGLDAMPMYLTAQFSEMIDPQDLGAAFAETFELSEGSEVLASESGGFTVKNNNDLAKGIQRIADESRTFYMLGYQSSNTARDGKYRKIQVRLAPSVARKGLAIRARKGYYAPDDSQKTKPAEAAAEVRDPAFQKAVDSPFDAPEIPIRMSAYVFDETTIGKLQTLVAAEVDVRGFALEEKDGRWHDALEFFLVAVHRESGEFHRIDQTVEMKLSAATRERLARSWFPIVREFELKPGAYQAKLVVRDRNNGRVGSATHEFIVKEPLEFRTCTPVVSDTLEPRKDADEPPRPALVAHRDFEQGSQVYMLVDVYAAQKDEVTTLPKVSMGYEVRRVADGTVWTSVDASVIRPTSIGKVNRLVGFRLDDAEPGEYEIVIEVKDEIGNGRLRMHEPFTVKPVREKPVASAH